MKKLIILSLVLLVGQVVLMAGDLSFSFHESIRNPLIDSKPVDYEVSTQIKFKDMLDVYYLQERTSGLNEIEYWASFQYPLYRNVFLGVKRHVGKEIDLSLLDLKYRFESNGWKTYVGLSNIWEFGKYKPKALLEESRQFSFDFFLVPFDLNLYTKLLTDVKKLYHEERLELRFKMLLPTSWAMTNYIDAYVKLFVLAKDYGYYRWQQKLMIEFEIK